MQLRGIVGGGDRGVQAQGAGVAQGVLSEEAVEVVEGGGWLARGRSWPDPGEAGAMGSGVLPEAAVSGFRSLALAAPYPGGVGSFLPPRCINRSRTSSGRVSRMTAEPPALRFSALPSMAPTKALIWVIFPSLETFTTDVKACWIPRNRSRNRRMELVASSSA